MADKYNSKISIGKKFVHRGRSYDLAQKAGIPSEGVIVTVPHKSTFFDYEEIRKREITNQICAVNISTGAKACFTKGLTKGLYDNAFFIRAGLARGFYELWQKEEIVAFANLDFCAGIRGISRECELIAMIPIFQPGSIISVTQSLRGEHKFKSEYPVLHEMVRNFWKAAGYLIEPIEEWDYEGNNGGKMGVTVFKIIMRLNTPPVSQAYLDRETLKSQKQVERTCKK